MKQRYFLLSMLLFVFLVQPGFTFGQSNQYLHFDKVDDFVKLDGASQYIASAGAISMTGWFYCDALAYGQGMMGLRTSGNGFYLIQLNDGAVECRLETGNGLFEYVAPAGSTIPQVWQHWAWVYDGSACKLYVNGSLMGSTSASGEFTNTNVSFAIGKSTLAGFNFVYGGRIDEVSLWNIALTQGDIQDIMDNELTGTEPGLQLYYKMNQGDPGGNNTSITHLVSEVDSPTRDAELLNFALTGENSNFNGTVNVGYQAISFPQIPNHLTTDPSFDIEATASSGLTVQFEVLSGPATIDGNTVTLTGDAGEVIIEATQPGNATYDPAEPVQNSFMVLDPATNVAEIDPRSPLAGDVYVPDLDYIQLAAYVIIEYPELFSVQNVQLNINGQSVQATNWGEGYYTGWWVPPAYGSYTLNIVATSNFGTSTTESVNINVVEQVNDMEVQAVDDVWLSTDNPSQEVMAELPCYTGAFNQVTATLEVTCPPGGCGEWDRVASIDARGHNGKWVEIIRYITPYSLACSHTIDLTDYMSVLQGKVTFRLNCFTLDNGYYYDLTFNYSEGTPAWNFSTIDTVWWQTFQFGDYANFQPVPDVNFTFNEFAQAATLKLVATGHGWGNLNTGNAAEFHNDTHHIWVNGVETFEQHNWAICFPNPDGCDGQNGTWTFNRAGWCPGSIAPWFDYDLTPYVEDGDIILDYVFNPDYVDYCHPNHPDCVTGVTCSDCDDGFNPHLITACNLVTFSSVPVDDGNIVSVENTEYDSHAVINLFPNPTNGLIELSTLGKSVNDEFYVHILDVTGTTIQKFEWDGEIKTINLSEYPAGLYFIDVRINDRKEMFKVVLH
jgi:hypothetical protein